MNGRQTKTAGRLAATLLLWLSGAMWAHGAGRDVGAARDGEAETALTWDDLSWEGDVPGTAKAGERVEWTVRVRKLTWEGDEEYGWYNWEDIGEEDGEWSVDVVQPDGTPLEGEATATAGEWDVEWTLGFETSQTGIHLVFMTLKTEGEEFTQVRSVAVYAGEAAFGLTKAANSNSGTNTEDRLGIVGTVVGTGGRYGSRVLGILSDAGGNLLGEAETALETGGGAFALDFGQLPDLGGAEECFLSLRLFELGGSEMGGEEEEDDGDGEPEDGEESEDSDQTTWEAETDARDGRFVRTVEGWEYRAQTGMEVTWGWADQVASAGGGTEIPDLRMEYDMEHSKSVSGTYEVEGTLRMWNGTLLATARGVAELVISGPTEPQTTEGLSMAFDGAAVAAAVAASGEEGPFYLVFGEWVFRNEETGVFEPCGRVLQGGWEASDWSLWVVEGSEKERLAESAGGDAACDLVVSFDLSFGKEMAGTYEVSAMLEGSDDDGEGWLWTEGTGTVTLAASGARGTQTVELRFAGGAIAEAGVDGPWTVYGLRMQSPEDEDQSHDFVWSFGTAAWRARDFAGEAAPLTVWRFYSKAYKGHFFTISEGEKQDLIDTNPNWKFEGGAYRAFTNEAAGTTPLYRFYSKGYRGHFFTIDAEEAEEVKKNHNWKYEGIAYYVYPEEVEGSVAVFRFWSKGYRHHFYTIDAGEKDNLIATNPNWKYEGIAFWALPLGQSGEKGTGEDTKTRTTPVAVPRAWLAGKASRILSARGGNYESAANATAANGRKVWECYVAGLDPEDAEAEFRATIRWADGKMTVVPNPDLGAARSYTVEGTERMGGAWGATNAETRFFRVKVGMPE